MGRITDHTEFGVKIQTAKLPKILLEKYQEDFPINPKECFYNLGIQMP